MIYIEYSHISFPLIRNNDWLRLTIKYCVLILDGSKPTIAMAGESIKQLWLRVPCGCQGRLQLLSLQDQHYSAGGGPEDLYGHRGKQCFFSFRTKQKECFLEANNSFVGFDSMGLFMGFDGDLVEFNGEFSCFFMEFHGDLDSRPSWNRSKYCCLGEHIL